MNLKIKKFGEWIINNSDAILKLVGSLAIVVGTFIVARYESKISAINLINQREQAESGLRSNMFSHLITPVAGPQADKKEIDPHRERVLVELLALNFHEHFEFKPLMLHVDKRLAGDIKELEGLTSEQAEKERDSLRSIARRVTDRQIAMLIKEGASEPEDIQVYVQNNDLLTGYFTKGDLVELFPDENEQFKHDDFFNDLITLGIIKKTPEDPDFLQIADNVISKKNQVIAILKNKKTFVSDKKDQLKDILEKEDDVIPLKNEAKEEFRTITPPSNFSFFSYKNNVTASVYLRVEKINTLDGTVDIVYFVKYNDDEENTEYAHQKFTLTYYDFPLTDNTLLRDGNRFSIVLDDIDEDSSTEFIIVTLKAIWYPKDFFTTRERPINYKEFRKKLNI